MAPKNDLATILSKMDELKTELKEDFSSHFVRLEKNLKALASDVEKNTSDIKKLQKEMALHKDTVNLEIFYLKNNNNSLLQSTKDRNIRIFNLPFTPMENKNGAQSHPPPHLYGCYS